ncbi:hypothetical protein BDV09DRAFT_167386 [Aspergillus tetrazonus]
MLSSSRRQDCSCGMLHRSKLPSGRKSNLEVFSGNELFSPSPSFPPRRRTQMAARAVAVLVCLVFAFAIIIRALGRPCEELP